MSAMARADAPCPSASSPLGVTKCASAPSSSARAFIMAAKFSTLPPMCSAMATAASLPERSMSPLSISSMLSVSPALK